MGNVLLYVHSPATRTFATSTSTISYLWRPFAVISSLVMLGLSQVTVLSFESLEEVMVGGEGERFLLGTWTFLKPTTHELYLFVLVPLPPLSFSFPLIVGHYTEIRGVYNKGSI